MSKRLTFENGEIRDADVDDDVEESDDEAVKEQADTDTDS